MLLTDFAAVSRFLQISFINIVACQRLNVSYYEFHNTQNYWSLKYLIAWLWFGEHPMHQVSFEEFYAMSVRCISAAMQLLHSIRGFGGMFIRWPLYTSVLQLLHG